VTCIHLQRVCFDLKVYSKEDVVKHEHYLAHLFWNPPFCASIVSWCRRCRIFRYVVAPNLHPFLLTQILVIQMGAEGSDQREGWPLLTVETEVNGDSKSTNERGPSLVSSYRLSCLYMRFFSASSAVVGQIENIIFLTIHYFNFFVSIAQQAGQEVVLGRQSLNMGFCVRWCMSGAFPRRLAFAFLPFF
jgi:hypothetical protein